MAPHIKPVPTTTLADDDATVKALQGLVDYQPNNPDYSTAQLLQIQASLTQMAQTTKANEVALEQSRALWAETTHLYHDSVVTARTKVIAQYGADSTAVALIGLKRKSDRKRPGKRQKKTE